MKLVVYPIALLCAAFAFSSCSSLSDRPETNMKSETLHFKSSGTLIIAGRIPSSDSSLNAPSALGFLPFDFESFQSPKILIDTQKGSLRLLGFKGVSSQARALSEELGSLHKGSYEVLLKAENPTWHASENYYARQNKTAPAVGSGERFLAEVLGDKALFLDKELVLHSGLKDLDPGSALKLEPELMKLVFGQLEEGSQIEIR